MAIHAAWGINGAGIQHLPLSIGQPALRHNKRGAPNVAHGSKAFAGGGTVGDFQQGTLGVTKDQNVRLGIHQRRLADFVAPVVVLGNAAQAGFNAANQHIHPRVGLAATLGIDRHGTVGPFARHGGRGIGIVGAGFFVGGVAVNHRVHIARRHPKKQPRPPQAAEGVGTVPVWLANHPHPKALRLKQPPNQGHAKAGVVDIAISRHQYDVARLPA